MEEIDIETIRKRSIHGVIALISRTFFLNSISYATSLVIFTFLSTTDVGIYTAVIAMQRIISFFTDFGLGAALVQKKDMLTKEDLTTTFTIQTLVTGCIFFVVLFSQGLIASVFNLNSSAIGLLLVLIFTIFISSFKTIPSILLERKILFHTLIIPQIVESVVFNAILITLVLNNRGLESYTWAFLVSSIAGLPFYYLVSPWKINFGIHRNALSHLRYGLGFQTKNILATLKDDLLTVLLVKFLPYTQIGYIGFAQRNAFFAFRYVVDSVTRVSFSTYARVQHEEQLMRSAIEKSLYFVSLSMFPILFGVIVTMPYIILYFPRWQRWEGALLSVTFFCLNALFSSFSNVLVNVLDATGRVKTTLRLMVIWTVLTWVLTAVLVYFYGYNGVAIASFLVTLTIFYTVYLVKRIVPFDFIKSIRMPFISALVMVSIVYILAKFLVHDLVSLGFVILCGVGAYLSMLFLIEKEKLIEGVRIITKK